MILTSLPFALFVVATLAAYYELPRRLQPWVLLVASFGFYGSWSWAFPVALVVATGANFLIGRKLWNGAGKAWLAAGIVLNVLVLAVLKYAGVLAPDLVRALTAPKDDAAATAVAILLPLGFSYRVLENISFLVDASRRQLDGFPGVLEYALYAAWFPKLVSGPIERCRGFVQQLRRERIVDNDALARGAALVAVGLLRKILIADQLRGLVPRGLFEGTAQFGWVTAPWLLVAVFVVYNDFAGYTEIVRGVSALFGIELARNFKAPFFSRNVSELWLRWHMSLSFWLRDYVYMPLSRALLRRSAKPNTPVNLLVPPLAAMLVSALWHQAAWHMLLWGIVWGLFMALGRLPSLWRPVVPPDRQPAWRQGVGMLGVAVVLAVSNVLFAAELPVAAKIFRSIAGPGRWSGALTNALLLAALSLGIDALQHRADDEAVFRRWPLLVRSFALGVLLLALFAFTRAKIADPFIYQFF